MKRLSSTYGMAYVKLMYSLHCCYCVHTVSHYTTDENWSTSAPAYMHTTINIQPCSALHHAHNLAGCMHYHQGSGPGIDCLRMR